MIFLAIPTLKNIRKNVRNIKKSRLN